MPKLLTVSVLATLVTLLCGFSDLDVESWFNVHRGEPVPDVLAKLGRPSRIAHAEHRRIYYWQPNVIGGWCTIWGAAEHGIFVNWGYQSCF